MTCVPQISTARVYDAPDAALGARLLVDRLWPRGIRKADLVIDDWVGEAAPSPALRKWFAHDPDKWAVFSRRYHAELVENDAAVARCLAWCRKGPVVLLYAAKDRDHNHAAVLRDYLRAQLAQEHAS
ncbi:DUF488 domain-containing protein [Phaeovulum sp.]|uniref:DUF488 domain-containing protein n=1 Tax=Phaeovulum sp. TaxID=2934796 RepID=UPI00356860DF